MRTRVPETGVSRKLHLWVAALVLLSLIPPLEASAQSSVQPQEAMGKVLYSIDDVPMCKITNVDLSGTGKIIGYACSGLKLGMKTAHLDPEYITIVFGNSGIEKITVRIPSSRLNEIYHLDEGK